ncbi:MAG TPA: substrate-binding domain-containing protein, partial [Lentisphaeria bacterium]|nr:substrate-binding domain-containing protein [Lentisphaeria bacterium]
EPGAGDKSIYIRQARLRGYHEALTRVHVHPSPDWVVPGPWKLTAPGDELIARVAGPGGCTAVFAMSDLLAVWAYLVLRRAGYTVPRDISLAGFGGLHEGEWLETPLTTVRQDREGMGRAAVRMLLERAAHRDSPVQRLLLKPELAVNATTAPLPRARMA